MVAQAFISSDRGSRARRAGIGRQECYPVRLSRLLRLASERGEARNTKLARDIGYRKLSDLGGRSGPVSQSTERRI
jgi:hypothetical protein